MHYPNLVMNDMLEVNSYLGTLQSATAEWYLSNEYAENKYIFLLFILLINRRNETCHAFINFFLAHFYFIWEWLIH